MKETDSLSLDDRDFEAEGADLDFERRVGSFKSARSRSLSRSSVFATISKSSLSGQGGGLSEVRREMRGREAHISHQLFGLGVRTVDDVWNLDGVHIEGLGLVVVLVIDPGLLYSHYLS